MTRTLLIDDERSLTATVTARTYIEGVRELVSGAPWDELLLDHDLGSVERQYTADDRELTGYDVCRVLRHLPASMLPAKITLVTANPVGLENMRSMLRMLYGEISADGRTYSEPHR